jgi:hypothetical protein
MGAEVDGVDRHTFAAEFRSQVVVHPVQVGLGEEAAGEARLVGDDDQHESGFPEQAEE